MKSFNEIKTFPMNLHNTKVQVPSICAGCFNHGYGLILVLLLAEHCRMWVRYTLLKRLRVFEDYKKKNTTV